MVYTKIYKMIKTGRIYKIITSQSNDCYVGSTLNTLAQRFKNHKKDYKRFMDGKTRGCSAFDLFDKYGVIGCKMILIKEYDVVDRRHLEAYETLWIIKLKSVNKVMPFGKGIKYLDKEYQKQYNKQYRENNKEVICDKKKQYYETNKEVINEKKKQYYETNKEVICDKNKQYRDINKQVLSEKGKIYRDNNKEVICEKKKKYYETNKEEISQYYETNKEKIKKYYELNKDKLSKKIACECGAMIRKDSLARHKKSKKHLAFLSP